MTSPPPLSVAERGAPDNETGGYGKCHSRIIEIENFFSFATTAAGAEEGRGIVQSTHIFGNCTMP